MNKEYAHSPQQEKLHDKYFTRYSDDSASENISQQSPKGKSQGEISLSGNFQDQEHLDQSTSFNMEEGAFICPYKGCNKVFSRKLRLNAHLHMHYGTQPFKCEHPGCGKAFSEKQNLRIHMRIHKDERPFVCPQGCGKSFRTKGNMQDHERRHFNNK